MRDPAFVRTKDEILLGPVPSRAQFQPKRPAHPTVGTTVTCLKCRKGFTRTRRLWRTCESCFKGNRDVLLPAATAPERVAPKPRE